VTITPMVNHISENRISYDIEAFYDGKNHILEKGTSKNFITLPKGKSGELVVTAYLDGIMTNKATEYFISF